MASQLSRRGARAVTQDLDKLATVFQSQHSVLGVPEEYALRFAYYCDVMSDAVEKHAIRLAGDEEKPKDEEEAKKEAADITAGCEKLPEGGMRDNCEKKKEEGKEAASKKSEDKDEDEEAKKGSKKKAVDETGTSVEPAPGNQGFDANDIADEKAGPLEIIAPVEGFMGGHFTQERFQQLREKQEGGQIGFKVSASMARLRRLAAVGQLSALEDLLKVIHAKLSASDMTEVKGLAGDVKKQIDAVSKVRDVQLQQQAIGMVEPEVVTACDRIYQAVTEQIPYLEQVVNGVDGGSPVALLEFQKMVGGGSLKDLVGLGASIVTDAAKGIGKKDDPKEAKAAGEGPEAFNKNWHKSKDDKDESKKEAAKSEDDKSEDKEEGTEKSASASYDLFSV